MKSKVGVFMSILPSLLMALSIGELYAQQKELRKLRLNVFRTDAATAAARVRGLFATEGLEVAITTTPNSTDQMRGISNGTYEIASTGFDNVLAWSGREGAEIVAIAQISDRTVLPVFVRPEIKSWSDLKGKKLAADAVDTAFALVLRRILLANGLDLNRKNARQFYSRSYRRRGEADHKQRVPTSSFRRGHGRELNQFYPLSLCLHPF